MNPGASGDRTCIWCGRSHCTALHFPSYLWGIHIFFMTVSVKPFIRSEILSVSSRATCGRQTTFSFFIQTLEKWGHDWNEAIQSAVHKTILEEIEILAIGIRCVHNLGDGHTPHRSSACIHYNGIIVASQRIAYKIPMASQGFIAPFCSVASRHRRFDCESETALWAKMKRINGAVAPSQRSFLGCYSAVGSEARSPDWILAQLTISDQLLSSTSSKPGWDATENTELRLFSTQSSSTSCNLASSVFSHCMCNKRSNLPLQKDRRPH